MGFRPYDPNSAGVGTFQPLAPSGGLYQGDSGNWVPVSQTTSQTAFMWDSDTSKTDPGAGNIKANNSDYSLITEIYISGTAQGAINLLDVWKSAARGDFAAIRYAMDNSNYIIIQATDYSVDEGGWISVPVNIIDQAGTIPNDGFVTLTLLPTSPRANNIGIERLLDGLSLAANQQPTGTGEANSIQIEFGAAQGTVNDAVMIDSSGVVTFNDTGLYRVKVSLVYGRQGGGGASELRFRALVNGIQAGQSIGAEIDNAMISIPFSDEAWLYIPGGTTVAYELMRDSSGNNSGGVFQPVVTAGTAPNWNACTCAAIRIERWSNV